MEGTKAGRVGTRRRSAAVSTRRGAYRACLSKRQGARGVGAKGRRSRGCGNEKMMCIPEENRGADARGRAADGGCAAELS
jgi:hypothetical protein